MKIIIYFLAICFIISLMVLNYAQNKAIHSLSQQIEDINTLWELSEHDRGVQKTRIDNIETIGYKAAECIVNGDMDGLTELAWGAK